MVPKTFSINTDIDFTHSIRLPKVHRRQLLGCLNSFEFLEEAADLIHHRILAACEIERELVASMAAVMDCPLPEDLLHINEH